MWSVDPGDLRTRMHQEAFPGEDISDRPEPADGGPGPARPDRRRTGRPAGSGSTSSWSPSRSGAIGDPASTGLGPGRADGGPVRPGPASTCPPSSRRPPRPRPGACAGTGSGCWWPAARRRPPEPPPLHRSARPARGRRRAGGQHVGHPARRRRRRPADGRAGGLHLSGRLPGGLWMVELRHRPGRRPAASRRHPVARRRPSGTGRPAARRRPGRAAGARGVARPRRRPWRPRAGRPGCGCGSPPSSCPSRCSPTWPATAGPSATRYVPQAWPISSYQTVFAEVPGSAEMPSAARPFSAEVITRLVARGVSIAPFVLHCGVSSPEEHEPPAAEWYRVPPTDRRPGQRRPPGGPPGHRRRHDRRAGARDRRRQPAAWCIRARAGPSWWSTPDRPVRAVDGLITGLARAGRLAPGPAGGGRRAGPGRRFVP